MTALVGTRWSTGCATSRHSEIGEHRGQFFMALELMEGKTLHHARPASRDFGLAKMVKTSAAAARRTHSRRRAS